MFIANEPFAVTQEAAGYTVSAAAAGRYDLYWSFSPDGFTDDNWLGAFETVHTVQDPAPGRRVWFHILNDQTDHFVTAVRQILLPDIENLRDMGGYLAKDGRAVRWGKFYRSARLGQLLPEAYADFEKLGIKAVLDLRSEGEEKRHPNPKFDGIEQVRYSAMFQMDGNEATFDPAALLKLSEEEMAADEEFFKGTYRTMPFDNKAFHWMFDRLEKGALPLLFHCTAGKDRTGMAAALILLALGVERSVVEADYMMTNHCCQKSIKRMVDKYYTPDRPAFVKEYLTCIAGVGLHNLAAGLDAVLEKHGSWEAYFEAEYGLDAQRLARLRDLYLEPIHP